MSDTRSVEKKTGSERGRAGDLARDVARLAEEAGVATSDVYAFLCNGYVSGGSSNWLDKDVSPDALEYLTRTIG